VLNIHTVLEI